MSDKQPIYIVPENVSRTLGKDAQRNNILAAKTVSDIVKTTLGPKGMDKMLVDSVGNIIITNDGVTILEEMEIDHPAAKMIVEIAKAQESEVGDGTTTVAMLAGKLLENAEKLLDKKIHPTVIVKGYKLSSERSQIILDEISLPIQDKGTLHKIAKTAMTGKGAEGNRDHLATLSVDAIDIVAEGNKVDLSRIKLQKVKGEAINQSELIHGIVLDKEAAHEAMPKKVEMAKILLVNIPLELQTPETETKVSISSPQQLQEFINSEEKLLKDMTDKIIRSGAKVIFCQKGIDDVAQYYLAKAGVFACRRVTKSDMEMLSKAVSGEILSKLDEIQESSLGYAEKVESIKKGEETMTYVSGCKNPGAVTILVKGTTEHIVDEIERAIKDGLGDIAATVKDGKIVPGGGAIEVELAKRLREFARTIGGREQLAIHEYASALESIPETLAENAGLDPITILAELKQRHETLGNNQGLNVFSSGIEDMIQAGIVEPLKVKTQAIQAATEVATMILRIDDVLIAESKNPGRSGMPPRYEGMD